jgi:hypothetical protein
VARARKKSTKTGRKPAGAAEADEAGAQRAPGTAPAFTVGEIVERRDDTDESWGK